MSFDFPASPTDGQTYSPAGGPDYIYRTASGAWEIKTGGTSSAFVAKAGDTMTGHLALPTAPGATNAVRKDYVDTANALKLDKTGGTLTGALTVTSTSTNIYLQKTVPAGQNFIYGMNGVQARWALILGNAAAESGGNVGSDFSLWRYDDSGTPINASMVVDRKTGQTSFYGTVTQQGGDFWVQQAVPNQTMGNIRFGTDPGKYLWFNGTDFHFGGGHLVLDDAKGINVNTGQFNGAVNMSSTLAVTGTMYCASTAGAKSAFYLDSLGAGNNPQIVMRDQTNSIAATFFWDRALDELGWSHYSGTKIRLASWGVASTHDTCYKPSGGPWVAGSDARIKTVKGDYQHGLDEVLALHPVVYSYKGNDSFGKADPNAPNPSLHSTVIGKEYIGLVAQECETVMPEMVSKVPGYIDGNPVPDLRTLDTGALIYALVNSIKTLTARIEALEAAQAP
jgi:Chaperone of endosialidase